MFATLFASLFVQGILLGLAALALLAAAPRLQKRLLLCKKIEKTLILK